MLIIAGFQVPVIPFVDVVGNVPGVDPMQYGPSAVNEGTMFEFTVTDILVVVAHNPAVGVKVYMLVPAVEVLITAGFQLPVIPFVDVVGNIPGTAPIQ